MQVIKFKEQLGYWTVAFNGKFNLFKVLEEDGYQDIELPDTVYRLHFNGNGELKKVERPYRGLSERMVSEFELPVTHPLLNKIVLG